MQQAWPIMIRLANGNYVILIGLRPHEDEAGRKITSVKLLTLAEEYLQDHFPSYPVLPGVMMLEALTQASAWLIRASEDFAHSVVELKEARNVKYGNFVEPGQVLGVIGAPGSGKSTLLHLLGGLDAPSSGEIRVQGQLLSNLGEAARGAAIALDDLADHPPCRGGPGSQGTDRALH